MAAQLRQLRQRIKTVKSTAKITRAQEMIATSRIVKAQQAVAASKPYADQITQALTALVSHHVGIDHPLLQEQPADTRSAVLIITSDRGFCGAYNANVIREAESLIRALRDEGREPVPYVVGNKGITWYRFRDRDVAQTWSGFSDRPAFGNAEAIGRRLTEDFLKTDAEGGVGEIHVVYTEFVSMLTQTVRVARLMPLEIAEAETSTVPPAYEFEPSAQAALDMLLPNYVESRIFHMLLQSAASFQAAVRRAMKSATDNANELLGVYTRQMNQARQAAITQEISEIVGGADALAESGGE
ncbi:F0F1 ATP synthase subunit gamma [Actinomadura madurae]|uniref:F0F1 ATP synthase subunit gamma n=1 Tax=Actinomadura madurae TaxID=1993 RepID=UPI0020274B6D|nr:F0F1 ATP synthase subunit gamma [Actinomadura madurae]MCP9953615.1 F0F1 ATP synthase subunit gamma [Actinomadura madurae]MCP9970370.1 F0F1 ATP synthase subunit gamma [Actinomadura madurae]MCP9982851.1 F0F1 ATP synthase subunit gamma [Actinomadura madurae]MCQ0005599.1 F0F1 ATP synthase subunit gamma [Actinomadura madurae]MCQ0019083.1 F0F1 ATP synthase subunit gamma [Actinomadura madurae]